MPSKKSKVESINIDRHRELKKMLEERQRELEIEVRGKMKGVRAAKNGQEPLDEGESSEATIQEDIEIALMQMKAETLSKINEALRRLEEGQYGVCFNCEEEISEARLRALPFAVRCKKCEEAREAADQRRRALARQRGGNSLFYDLQG